MDERLKRQLDFILEIDAGDTYAYDPEGLRTQKVREQIRKGNLPEE